MNPSRPGNDSLNGNGNMPPDRVEFEALKGRVTAAEWRLDHTDGRVMGVDGAEQDLREQVRELRQEIATFREVIMRRVPTNLERGGLVTFVAMVAAAVIAKLLGVPMPDVTP